jgi:hypothetical protein
MVVIFTEYAILLLDAIALVVIVTGSLQAVATGSVVLLSSPTGHERREIWLRYARWLVVGSPFSSRPISSRPRSRRSGRPSRGRRGRGGAHLPELFSRARSDGAA